MALQKRLHTAIVTSTEVASTSGLPGNGGADLAGSLYVEIIMGGNAIARRLLSIQEKGAMRSSDVANVLSVRPETVSRWNQGKAFPHPDTEKQLLELEFLVDKLSDFYEPRDARLWIFARQRVLADQVPAELIQQGRVDEVLAAVNQLRDGVFL